MRRAKDFAHALFFLREWLPGILRFTFVIGLIRYFCYYTAVLERFNISLAMSRLFQNIQIFISISFHQVCYSENSMFPTKEVFTLHLLASEAVCNFLTPPILLPQRNFIIPGSKFIRYSRFGSIIYLSDA